MALSREEREQFLAEPHVASIAVASGGEGRAPLTVPIWYQYEPGGDVWIMTGAESRKARLIGPAGRFSLLAQRVRPTARYVSVEGPVIDTVPSTPEHLLELASRYLAPENVPGYIEAAQKEHGDQVVMRMRPQYWVSSDLGAR